jgi:hypothetical protein
VKYIDSYVHIWTQINFHIHSYLDKSVPHVLPYLSFFSSYSPFPQFTPFIRSYLCFQHAFSLIHFILLHLILCLNCWSICCLTFARFGLWGSSRGEGHIRKIHLFLTWLLPYEITVSGLSNSTKGLCSSYETVVFPFCSHSLP